MSENTTQHLSVEALPDYEPTVGRWLWACEDTRRQTRDTLTGLEQTVLDWMPFQGGNSIGTLLYHIAAIELDWLYVEVLEEQAPWQQEMKELFATDVRDDQGHLSAVRGMPLVDHLQRLDRVREHLLTSFRRMTLEEFRRPRSFPAYSVTPEWVLHHLIQHETEHRGHMQLLRSWAEQALGQSNPHSE